MYRLGIDVGGTFTDLAIVNEESGEIDISKSSSTAKDPSIGIVEAIRKSNINLSEVSHFVHATTVGTNAVLQRRGGKVGLITTKGFKDVLALMREVRDNIYSYQWSQPKPLVPGHLRFEVSERINYSGDILIPIDVKEARAVVTKLKAEAVDSIAVCFLFSFMNPIHEKMLREIIQEIYPEANISVSHELLPEIREYDRTSTVVIDAFLKTIMDKYAVKLQEGMATAGYRRTISMFKTNGGITTLENARRYPVNTLSAGPVGGVIAQKFIGGIIGKSNIIGLDMGGTSADVNLIYRGVSHLTTDWQIEWGIPVKVPFVEVDSVGAGGGTIAWFDKAGALKSGPQSAGAEPGPACYGKGGEEPTVTDANLVLGRLNAQYFVGGAIPLYLDLSIKAITEKICPFLNSSLEEAAIGILDVTTANMVQAINRISVQRGYDLREFSLFAFGGAGPMHAIKVAESLGIHEVIVPIHPGITSAFGLLVADVIIDDMRSYPGRFAEIGMKTLLEIFSEMEEKALRQVKEEGYERDITIARSADMRYIGQHFETEVVFPNGRIGESERLKVIDNFKDAYERRYGLYVDEALEILTLRIRLIVPTKKAQLKRIRKGTMTTEVFRNVYLNERYVRCPIYTDDMLRADAVLEGPFVLEKLDSTVLVFPGQTANVDDYGNMMISV